MSQEASATKKDQLTNLFKELHKQAKSKGVEVEHVKKALYNPDEGKALKKYLLYGAVCFGILCVIIQYTVDFDELKESKCMATAQSEYITEVLRPPVNCDNCKSLTSVPVERDLSAEDFARKYAYSSVPVLVKDATLNWTAMSTFSFNFFRKLYTRTPGAVR